ncbi:class III extradiol ring-cleavage dioxygenase [Xylophilus sp. GOD-11R]|uniref:DODA-type extradiol aromatic ring-opening family dioxygenase n=1 Tax=Xylophilus sp. GOD-11R TaxID=3089814 RepID=UPI00298C8879|nr:class III extradiol ring-cleavage dioxygenase [Xylophilus sp. GOD-11R]WPB57955.1 class III extradiol ring-cleavage dioxygenase [Xylophilus sp. GOD-11R]
MNSDATTRLPVYFISHGGGPWPWIPEMRSRLATLEASLADIPRQIGRTPRAVLMISGHWEADRFQVMGAARPGMVYDYYGFPAHTYQIHYDAPGAPDVAEEVRALLAGAGLPVQIDGGQGFDHGTFAPLEIMYPQADVPVLQLSLQTGYDVDMHLAAGRALAPLRDRDVLIVASGLSYHNLRNFGPAAAAPSAAFDAWLRQAMAPSSARSREAALRQWEQAPAARLAHPHEDHLVPLMMAVGAAGDDPSALVYHDAHVFGGVTASSWRFGDGPAPTPAAFDPMPG